MRLVAEEVALTRRHGLASALGRALRIQGQVLPGAAGMAVAEEAIRVLQGTPRRFELATAYHHLSGDLTPSGTGGGPDFDALEASGWTFSPSGAIVGKF